MHMSVCKLLFHIFLLIFVTILNVHASDNVCTCVHAYACVNSVATVQKCFVGVSETQSELMPTQIQISTKDNIQFLKY